MKAYHESRLTDLLVEFDEMGFCPTTVCPHPEQYAIEWKEQIVKEIQKLQAENAELRARHRAEVVERAFDNTIKVFHEILSAIFPDTKIDLDEWKKDNLANAEKELAEEGRQ